MKTMKNLLLFILILLSTFSFSQKASLTINKKNFFYNIDYKITKNGYICVLENERILKIYEPNEFKLQKEYNFKFDVRMDYISDNAELISITRNRSRTNKLFKALAGKKKKIYNYYSLINGEKLVGFNKFGNLLDLKKKIGVDGTINNGTFYTNTKHIEICFEKIRNKKHNNKKYFILTTDLITNKTTYKEFTINDEILLPASRSYAYKYKLKKSNRKTALYVSDYSDNSFTLMTRSYSEYTKKKKYPTVQKTQILKYDLEGNLKLNNILDNKIDPKMEFVDINSNLFPVSSYKAIYTTHTSSSGGTYTTVKYIPNEISLGYFFNPENTEEYYTYSLIKGIKSRDGVQIIFSKFGNDSNKIWSKNIILSEKKLKSDIDGFRSKIDLSHYKNTLSLSVSNNKDDFFKTFHINTINGDVSKPHDFEKIKYDSTLATRYYASYIKVKSISKRNLFSEETLRLYFLNNDLKKFIDNGLNKKNKYSLSTYINKDNIFLKAYKKRELKIIKF